MGHRLQWGKPDRLSLLKSQVPEEESVSDEELAKVEEKPAYFTADIPRKFISIILNDWPYSGMMNVFLQTIQSNHTLSASRR